MRLLRTVVIDSVVVKALVRAFRLRPDVQAFPIVIDFKVSNGGCFIACPVSPVARLAPAAPVLIEVAQNLHGSDASTSVA